MSSFFLFGVANGSTKGSFSLSTSTSLIYSLVNLVSRFQGLRVEEFPCRFSPCAGSYLHLSKCFKISVLSH